LAGFSVFSMRPRHGQTVSLVPFAAKRKDDRRVRAALAMRAAAASAVSLEHLQLMDAEFTAGILQYRYDGS